MFAPGTKAWMRNPHATSPPYILVTLNEEPEPGSLALATTGEGEEVRVDVKEDLFLANEEHAPDNSMLFHHSEAALLENLMRRHNLKLPYSTTGNTLISVNPCEPLPELYSTATMQQYLGRTKPGTPKHLYQVAEKAYRNLLYTGSCQAVVISGVSGAGKTEANKHILQFLCWRAAQAAPLRSASGGGPLAAARQLSSSLLDSQVSPLSRAILQSSSVCESFCNACTSNNHNSSRFGKFIRLLIDDDGAVLGASVDAYLLEKSRLVHQCAGERSFHVLYQLLADTHRRAQYGLDGHASDGAAAQPPAAHPALGFAYLSGSGRTTIASVEAAEARATTPPSGRRPRRGSRPSASLPPSGRRSPAF